MMILSMLGKLDPQPSPGGIVGDRTDLDGAGIKNALASMADWTKTAVNSAFEGPAAIKEAVGETLTNLQSVNDVMDNSFMVNPARYPTIVVPCRRAHLPTRRTGHHHPFTGFDPYCSKRRYA